MIKDIRKIDSKSVMDGIDALIESGWSNRFPLWAILLDGLLAGAFVVGLGWGLVVLVNWLFCG